MTHDVTANVNADEGGEGTCVLYLHAAQAPLRLLPPPIKQTTDRASLLFPHSPRVQTGRGWRPGRRGRSRGGAENFRILQLKIILRKAEFDRLPGGRTR